MLATSGEPGPSPPLLSEQDHLRPLDTQAFPSPVRWLSQVDFLETICWFSPMALRSDFPPCVK